MTKHAFLLIVAFGERCIPTCVGVQAIGFPVLASGGMDVEWKIRSKREF